jgi:hypothetical protein
MEVIVSKLVAILFSSLIIAEISAKNLLQLLFELGKQPLRQPAPTPRIQLPR